MNIPRTIAACKAKWGDDDNTRQLESKVAKWLSPVSGNQEKQILIKLLEHFEYYSRVRVHQELINLFREFSRVAKNIDYTIYTPIRSQKRHVNSSDEMVIEFRNLNSLPHTIVISDLGEIAQREEWRLIENVVFVDDTSGTGKTFTDFLEHYSDALKEKNIYLLVVVISEAARQNILDYADTNGLNIKIISAQSYKRAFERDNIFNGDDVNAAKAIIEQREVYIWGNPTHPYVMGKGRSEALISFVMNTPNNTISCFWSNNHKNWFPLFARRNDLKPRWSLSSQRKQQGVATYQATKLKKNE